MRTHHAIRPAAPGFTGGGDEVRTPCYGYAHVYDELGETSRTPEWAEALEAARNLCGTCLLNSPEIARPCLKRGLKERARWAHAVLGKPLRHVDHPTEGVMPSKVKHGTNSGYMTHLRNGEDPCDPCRIAHREYDRNYYATKRSKRAKGAA